MNSYEILQAILCITAKGTEEYGNQDKADAFISGQKGVLRSYKGKR